MGTRKRNNYKATEFKRGYISSRQTEQDLKELGEHVVAAAKAALKKEAEAIVAEAKTRCPVYEGHKRNGKVYMQAGVKPGALRDSIIAEPKDDETVYQISANAKTEDGFLYGQIVEFSPARGHPFLYPTFDAKKDEARKNIVDAIKSAVRRGR